MAIEDGDEIRVDLTTGQIENLSRPFKCLAPRLPGFLTEIMDAGGLTAYVARRIQVQKA